MRKLLCTFILAAGAVFAQTQPYIAYGIGGVSSAPTSVGSGVYNLNTTASWVSLGFRVPANKTLVKVRVLTNSVSGSTLGATQVSCDVQAEVNLLPSGTSLGLSNTLTTPLASPSSVSQWPEFTGYSVALTAYTPYRLVLKNSNTTSYPVIRTFNYFGSGYISGPASAVQTTTNSGSTWTQQNLNSTPIYRLEFADGSFQGYPVEAEVKVAAGINTNHRIRSTVSSGITFTTPGSGSWSVIGCASPIAKIGAPTGSLRCVIDSDNGVTVANLAVSANSYVASAVDTITHGNSALYFATPVPLSPASKYRVYYDEITGQSGSDSSSNYFGSNAWTMGNDANSLALLPMQGTWRGTYCAASCGTRANWVDDPVNIPGIGLLMNPLGEVTGTGSGGTRSYPH